MNNSILTASVEAALTAARRHGSRARTIRGALRFWRALAQQVNAKGAS